VPAQVWTIPLVAVAVSQVAVIATSVYLHRGESPQQPSRPSTRAQVQRTAIRVRPSRAPVARGSGKRDE